MTIYRHIRDMDFVEVLEEFIDICKEENPDYARKSDLREAIRTLTQHELVWDRK